MSDVVIEMSSFEVGRVCVEFNFEIDGVSINDKCLAMLRKKSPYDRWFRGEDAIIAVVPRDATTESYAKWVHNTVREAIQSGELTV